MSKIEKVDCKKAFTFYIFFGVAIDQRFGTADPSRPYVKA